MLPQRAVAPSGHKEALSVGMEQDAIGPVRRLPLLDHDAGLRVDDEDLVPVQSGRIEEPAVRRECKIAEKVRVLALFLRDYRKFAAPFELAVA